MLTAAAVSATIDKAPAVRLQFGLIVLVALVLVIDGLDVQILALIAPVIISEWGTSKAAFGPALAGALGGMAVGAMAGGWLGDRFGRRAILLAATLLFGSVTLAAGFAQDVVGLALLRFLSGIGFGAALPNGLALASEWTPARHKTRTLSVLAIGVPFGGMIGAPLALLVLPEFGWRGCFFVCGGITIAVLVLMKVYLPESPVFLATRGDIEGSRTALVRAFGNRIDMDTPDRELVSEDAPVAGRQGVLVRASLRMNAGSWMASFCIAAITYAVAAWSPVVLTSNGFQLAEAIRASFFHNAAAIVAALSASFLLNRFGSRRTLLAALGLTSLLLGAIGFIIVADAPNVAPEGRSAVVVLMGLIGATAGLSTATLYALLSLGYPQESRASGIGAGLTLGRLGAITMVIAGGFLIEIRTDGLVLYGVLASMALVALIGGLILDRHVPRAVGRAS